MAVIAAAHVAVLALGPLLDAPPAPGEHHAHLAAESQAGCHPYHDDYCVVCRAISADGVEGTGEPTVPESDDRAEPAGPSATSACTPRDDLADHRARAPPLV